MNEIEEDENEDEDEPGCWWFWINDDLQDDLHIHRTSKDDDVNDEGEDEDDDADNEDDDDEEPGCWWKPQPLDQIFVALPLVERNWTSLIMAH